MPLELGIGLSLPLASIGAAPVIIGGAVTSGSKTVQRVDAAGASLSGSQYNLGGAYYATHGAFALTAATIDGQAMIRVPRFWYRRAAIVGGANNGKECWWVSDRPAPGFVVHPAFMSGGVEVDCFWVGKYQGSNDGGTKVASVPGVLPLVSVSYNTFTARCAARNTGGVTGFMCWSIYQWAAIQMLAMIEMGSTDSQAAIGNGRVSQASAANVDAADVAQASWRGIVGLWGNVHQFIDGWRTTSNVIELWDRVGGKSWISTGITQAEATTNNYPVTMRANTGTGWDFRDVFHAATMAATGSATWPDYLYYTQAASRIGYVGGNWDYGAAAGLWTLRSNLDPADSATNLGGRLAKV